MLKKYSLVISTLLLTILFVKLYTNYADSFNEIKTNINVSTVDLSIGDSAAIYNVLHSQKYFPNKEDSRFVSGFIATKIKNGQTLPTLYDLNKRIWQIPDSLIEKEKTEYFISKLSSSRKDIGLDDEYNTIDINTLPSIATLDPNMTGEISVSVFNSLDNPSLIDKLLHKKGDPCENIVVRLSEQLININDYTTKRNTIKYLKTDQNGKVFFKGLDVNKSYSVLPINPGSEFGASKGTIGGPLLNCSNGEKGKLNCSFTQQEHRIRIFDAQTLKQIKEDRSLIVRSPSDFETLLTVYVALFFAAWWGLVLITKRKKRRIDISLIAILMTLTGLCLLTMFSLNDPLTDKLLGVDMAKGIIAGVFIIYLLQSVDFKKFYQNQFKIGFDIPLEIVKWLFKPFKKKVSYLTDILSNRTAPFPFKLLALICILCCIPFLLLDILRITLLCPFISRAIERLPKGCGYLFLALFLTALLFTPLGVSIGGMKVNLNVGIVFQPSEIAKYLIVVFMAAFFSINANSIVQYSKEGNAGLFGSKIKMLTTIIIGLGLLMGIYLVLGDMGPALVLAFTFIILYSVIKSKIDLEGLTPTNQLKQILSCDLAMLIYGILSYVFFLLIGNKMSNMPLLCVAWFVFWILLGSTRKQIIETPILFNLIITAFIFGGSIMSGKLLGNNSKFASVAERLDSRIEMCTNTWGTLPIDAMKADAGQNTQVAEGLWGLASGGIFGQGLGNGTPHFIPAFHTDMILESIGEQMGLIGLVFIIILIAVLLRKTIVLGYKSTHPFIFYLCTGIAVVTAVQFIIISLGSTGVIPLTGVTVPFLSYGKVSMILNLVAYGIILSITTYEKNEIQVTESDSDKLIKRNIGKYNYTVSILSWSYCIVTIFIMGVFYYYQIFARNSTMIRPVYVNNDSGIPVIQYNPRIEQLTNKMFIGDIYDRNGVLLATSNITNLTDEKQISYYRAAFGNKYFIDTSKRQSRYYPFGKHLMFMLGDLNSDLFTFHSENTGYSAEIRHFSDLRGYNRRVDKKGNQLPKVILSSSNMQIDKWHAANKEYKDTVALLNYTALLPYLKAGVNSNKLKKYNNREKGEEIIPKDKYLTIDALLQTKIQHGLEDIFQNNIETKLSDKNEKIRLEIHKNIKEELKKVRVSIVILDANKGDLLASANYPLPSPERLKSEIVNNQIPSYRDYDKPKDWEAYTDLDLGLLYPTHPGSTAKVMSALAGLKKAGISKELGKSNYKYKIYRSQKVGDEPPFSNGKGKDKPTDYVIYDMRDALVWSSNCYFINFINDHMLYNELVSIYRTVGARINYDMPYVLSYADSSSIDRFYNNISTTSINDAILKYRDYIEKKETKPMRDPIWQWTWGQGDLTATPLAISRVASIVANRGKLATTRFTLDEESQIIPVISEKEAETLDSYMHDEAILHTSYKFAANDNVGGKTGTAQNKYNEGKRNAKTIVDGWYMFYIKASNNDYSDLAVAIRIEHGKSSTYAKHLARDFVMETLKEMHYISQ